MSQTHTEIETIDAEFVDESPKEQKSMVRRQPQSVDVQPVQSAKITMELNQWLDVDRTLHELYGLCEVALGQRDMARTDNKRLKKAKLRSDLRNEKLGNHVAEWKAYARKLEAMLHQSQLELLAQHHETQRVKVVAEEALTLGMFEGKRRKRLKNRLEDGS